MLSCNSSLGLRYVARMGENVRLDVDPLAIDFIHVPVIGAGGSFLQKRIPCFNIGVVEDNSHGRMFVVALDESMENESEVLFQLRQQLIKSRAEIFSAP